MTKKIRKIHENATDLVVDQSYIDAATAALEPLKSIDQTAYDAALKYLSRRTGTKLAVTPAKFAERRIAVAQTEEPVDANDSKSVEQKREELMQKTADKQRADFEQIKKDELERKNPTNGPKIVSIWIKKLNINKSNPMNDYADIQIEWSDGKTEDTTFDISTSGKTLDTIEWNDPNDLAKSKDELEYRGKVGDGGYSIKDGLL